MPTGCMPITDSSMATCWMTSVSRGGGSLRMANTSGETRKQTCHQPSRNRQSPSRCGVGPNAVRAPSCRKALITSLSSIACSVLVAGTVRTSTICWPVSRIVR